MYKPLVMKDSDIKFYSSCGFATMCFGQFLGSRVKDLPHSYLVYLSKVNQSGRWGCYLSWHLGLPRKGFVITYKDSEGKTVGTKVLAFNKYDALRVFKGNYDYPSKTNFRVSLC